MSSLQRIVMTTAVSADGFKSVCDLAPGQLPALNNLINFLASVPDQQAASLAINVGAVKATASITSTGAATANQTMKLCNQTLTAKASGAVPADGEFNASATVGTQATNIAATINAMAELSGIVTASASLGVVTVTSTVPGTLGNGLECADVDLSNVTVAGFEGGSDGTAYTLDLD